MFVNFGIYLISNVSFAGLSILPLKKEKEENFRVLMLLMFWKFSSFDVINVFGNFRVDIYDFVYLFRFDIFNMGFL
jgi:hypothetical protein